MDDEEDWVLQPSFWGGGTHLRLVSAHEIGHALGLPHSRQVAGLAPLLYCIAADDKLFFFVICEVTRGL